MPKRVNMGRKPGTRAKQQPNVDEWVESRGGKKAAPAAPAETEEKMKRLTLDIPESLHKAIKSRSVMEGVTMVTMLRELLEEYYGSK